METGGFDNDQESIGDLFGRLIDQGKGYARAEVGLAKAIATAKVGTLKVPVALFAAAFLFVIAGVATFCITIALALATLVGPLAGGLIATVMAFAIAGGLGFVATKKMSA